MKIIRCARCVIVWQAMLACVWAAPLTESAPAASWEKDFTLTDHLAYDFPEEQLSYPLDIPAGIKPENLRLLRGAGDKVRAIPFQLWIDGKGQNTLSFRTDLPQGATRLFRLVPAAAAGGAALLSVQAPVLQAGDNSAEAVLSNSLLQVKVPRGHQDFVGGRPLAQIPAPILALARAGRAWAATGSFAAPQAMNAESMDCKLVQSGPLFATYEVSYRLSAGRRYTAALELRANEPYVRIAESVEGFAPADQAFLQLNYGKGLLDPDRCLAMAGGSYFPRSRTPNAGGYDEHVSTNQRFIPWDSTTGWWDYDPAKDDSRDPQLNYCLSLYAPNEIGVVRSTTLFRDKGTDALVLALHRLDEWQTCERAFWTSVRATESLRFYSRSQDGQKYMTAGLCGAKRYWVLGLVPRDEINITIPAAGAAPTTAPVLDAAEPEATPPAAAKAPGKKMASQPPPAGPEARLFSQLNKLSLNAYKDRLPDWPETLAAAPFDSPDFYTRAAYEKSGGKAQSYREYEGHNKGLFLGDGRGIPARFRDYAVSRATWTQEQRERIRQFLLLFADAAEGDVSQCHHSMLSGHPNFLMDIKDILPFACATFPNHPRAQVWRASFLDAYNEWLDKYDRKDTPQFNAKGGRWSENIACYLGQCFSDLQPSQQCLKAYDGTSLGSNPQLFILIRWMRDSFMSPHDGWRMVPPEGAHSSAFSPGGHFWDAFFKLCADLAPEDPQLAAQMQWIQTNGKQGAKPDLHSALYTDYGPVFHYDFGGAHESYAHLQNINGPLNYRWGHGGIVYYGAKGKVWSFNADETNGDEFDWNQVSAFVVSGKGMEATPTDQLLYDFDFAQFYREQAQAGQPYLARGLMLLRDDYLVLSDEMQDAATAGTFNWVTLFDPPQIYQLKPGAPLQQKVTHDAPHPTRRTFDPGHPDTRTGKIFSYSGQGDFLTVVAPAAVQAVAMPFGATVNGEYVFASQKPQEVSEGPAVFSGTYGYARANQLALFQGTRIGLGGFELRREGGDFGVSAELQAHRITGRIVGRQGGKVFVLLPKGIDPAHASVTFGGQPIPHALEHGAVAFAVEIAQSDGLRNYEIDFGR